MKRAFFLGKARNAERSRHSVTLPLEKGGKGTFRKTNVEEKHERQAGFRMEAVNNQGLRKALVESWAAVVRSTYLFHLNQGKRGTPIVILGMRFWRKDPKP